MAFFKKITGLAGEHPKPTSQDVGNIFKLLLLTIIFLVIPPTYSRPIAKNTCPPTEILGSEFLDDFVDETKIDLSYCKIRDIVPGVFDDMIRLETLNLAGNKLGELQHGIFEECTALSTIDLSNNRLHFSSVPFLKSKSIKHLIIKDNEIKRISSATLEGLPNLESLDLRGNPICQIKECDMKSSDIILQWIQSQNNSASTNTSISKGKVDPKKTNATLPGKTDFAMKEDVYPILSAAVIIIGLCMAVCALIVICTPHEEYVRGTEGFRKLSPRVRDPPAPPKVELEEVETRDPERDLDLNEEPNWKKQLHLFYLIMKHSAQCGAQPIKL